MAGAELPGSKPSARLRAIQWTAVALVTVVIALNYIDRSTLSVGNLLIRKEFGISATAIGALQSGWSLAYAFAQIPVGFMLDRLGPHYLVGGALILWSIAQGAGGFAFGYTQLLWTRIALGITESPAYPAGVRVTRPADNHGAGIVGDLDPLDRSRAGRLGLCARQRQH